MADRALTRKRAVLLSGLLVLALMPLAARLLGEPFLISLFTRIVIYAVAAVSLDLIVGYGGLVSLGHGAFFGLGAYAVGILAVQGGRGLDVALLSGIGLGGGSALLVWPIAVAAAGVLALLIGALSLRTSGVFFIMITLAFAQMVYFFFVSLTGLGGADGISLRRRNALPGLDLGDAVTFYYVCLALLVGFLALCRRVVDSRFGMVLRGCKQNERRLRALGVATYGYKLVAFALAGAGAGLAGALIANHTEFVSPGIMHWSRSGQLLVMVLLGGMGTLFGPAFGAAALLLLEEVLVGYTQHWMIVLGPVLVLVVLFAPRGLYGWLAGSGSRDA